MKFWGGKNKEDRVGFYTTLIFHLAVLIVLLVVSIGKVASTENTFVLDFTKQEELERLQREVELQEQVARNLEDQLARQPQQRIRNVAVDAGSKLKDDRFKNPAEVYDEAKELQRKLDASKRDALAQKAAEEAVDLNREQKGEESNEPAPAFQGPSVISYELEGRVTAAKVRADGSSADASLHSFAIDAAKRSRFSASSDAAKSQAGWILYRFIAQ